MRDIQIELWDLRERVRGQIPYNQVLVLTLIASKRIP